MKNDPQLFVSVKELARQLSVHEATVRRWLREGIVPHVKIGGSLRIPTEVTEVLKRKSHDHVEAGAQMSGRKVVRRPGIIRRNNATIADRIHRRPGF